MRKFDKSCQLFVKRLFNSNSNALYLRTGSGKPSGIPSGMLSEPPVTGLMPTLLKQRLPIGAPVTGSSTSDEMPEVQLAGAVPPIGNVNSCKLVAASRCELGLPMKNVWPMPAFAASGDRKSTRLNSSHVSE